MQSYGTRFVQNGKESQI